MGGDAASATVTALVDVQCMYVSCERRYDASLRGRPAVVLSNNDGCVVSLSQEARDLGVKMGQPWFQVQADPALRGRVLARSSNYVLYATCSRRFVATLETVSPVVQQYSCDEAFVELPAGEAAELGELARLRCRERAGLPVRVGIGPTKTLAKLANKAAKHPSWRGVCDLTRWSEERLDRALAATPVVDVWGVGPRTARKLDDPRAPHGLRVRVRSALDLKRLDPRTARRIGAVGLERTVRELNGVACVAFEEPEDGRQVLCIRMFGHRVTDLEEMLEAVASHADEAASRLRLRGLDAGWVGVTMSTSGHGRGPKREVAHGQALPMPTDDAMVLAQAARRAARDLYRPGYDYARCGVILSDTAPAGERISLTGPAELPPTVWYAVDRLRHRYGPGSLRLGLGDRGWEMRRDMLSPAYTTKWADIPEVKTNWRGAREA